jgi:chromosome segregation ATPase
MSAPGSDDPTRRLPPVSTPPRRGRTVYLEGDEAVWRQEVLDRLRSHTTAITLVALLAFAAFGVGLWAVFSDAQQDEGASSARVRSLEQRVERVESALSRRDAALDDVATLRDRQQALEQRLQGLEQRIADSAENLDSTAQAITGTQQAIEQLEERVDQLEQAAP